MREEVVGVEIAGRRRTALVVTADAPAGDAIFVVLHGDTQTGPGFRRATGHQFDALTAHGVVAYANGYRRTWNDAGAVPVPIPRRHGVDSVPFVRALAAELARRYGADSSRLYAVGFSRGGSMVIRLLLEAGAELAGAGIVASTLAAPENRLDVDRGPARVPIALIHGTHDRIVPYAGGGERVWGVLPRGRFLSAPQTAEFFAERNGHPGPPTVTTVGHDRTTTVTRTVYGEDSPTPVVLYTVEGGGHAVPGPRPAPFVLGRTTRVITAATEFARVWGLGASR